MIPKLFDRVTLALLVALLGAGAVVVLGDLPPLADWSLLAAQAVLAVVGTARLYLRDRRPARPSRHRRAPVPREPDPIAASLIAGILLFAAIIAVGEATGGLGPALFWPLLAVELVEVGLLVGWWTSARRSPDGAR